MAISQTGLLTLAATKASWVVFPLGLVGIAAIWVSRAHTRRSVPPAREGSTAAYDAANGKRAAYKPATGPSARAGSGREALLSQVLEDNIRLREALK